MTAADRDRFATLEDVLRARGVPQRDCRNCERFVRDEDGLDCGWCSAHDMWVKLYQQPASWHTQCQFLQIRRERGSPDSPHGRTGRTAPASPPPGAVRSAGISA